MTSHKAIESLRMMARKSKAANDFFHSCAARKRARGALTVLGVEFRMKQEGFEHSREEYADILKALATAGFGELRFDRKGRVSGLTNLRTKLSSIGAAVLQGGEIKNFRPRNKFESVVQDTTKPVTKDVPKAEVVQALNSVDELVKSILSDTSIPAERRTAAALVLLEK